MFEAGRWQLINVARLNVSAGWWSKRQHT